ncbi:hypothetical protein HDU89_008392 [Geranomyces variabilis]|nr:hypothetical protein HDU89_008392 [Geranomyces variabilis]
MLSPCRTLRKIDIYMDVLHYLCRQIRWTKSHPDVLQCQMDVVRLMLSSREPPWTACERFIFEAAEGTPPSVNFLQALVLPYWSRLVVESAAASAFGQWVRPAFDSAADTTWERAIGQNWTNRKNPKQSRSVEFTSTLPRLDILHRFVRDAQEAGVNLKSADGIMLRDLVYKHNWTGTGGDYKCEILKCLRSAGETLKDDPISFPKWLRRWKDPRDCAEATQAIESLLELGFDVERISVNYKEWCEQQGVPFALLAKYGSSWAIRFLQGEDPNAVLTKCDPRRWQERHCCVNWKSVVHCICLLK